MKLRPALKYNGAKWLLAPWIIEHFPKHSTSLMETNRMTDKQIFLRTIDNFILVEPDGTRHNLGRCKVFWSPDGPQTIDLEFGDTAKRSRDLRALIIVWTLRALALLAGFALVMWGKQ